MLRYTLKRALSLALSLCLASVIIFAVVEVAPGDPASFMLGINAQPDTVAALRAAADAEIEVTLVGCEQAAALGAAADESTARIGVQVASSSFLAGWQR